jgi:hypothetical protein
VATTFNFSDIQKAAEEKFGDYEVIVPVKDGKKGETETLTFVHLLRAPKALRQAYAAAIDPKTYADDEEAQELDVVEGLSLFLKESFRVVAKTPRDFERLAETVRDANGGLDDMAVWQELFASYQAETQVGEA